MGATRTNLLLVSGGTPRMSTRSGVILMLGLLCGAARAERVVWLEAEGFDSTGGWSNDSQFVDVMGSPYLLATATGKPVADAVTAAKVPEAGGYRLWVRCRDWLPGHAPGRFRVSVGGQVSEVVFGRAQTSAWRWVEGGTFALPAGAAEVRLRDATGWWGRCDAVVLASGGFRPSDDPVELARQRARYGGVSAAVEPAGAFDVVVVGGGPAGLGAALAAARHGCRVALVQDRPVLGGNASSEIEIPPMGYIGKPPDTINVTGIAEEIFPPQGWSNFADSEKLEAVVRAEPDIALFLNTRATDVEMADAAHIRAVTALDVRGGRRLSFAAPRFIDCTGHGWIGYYAGAAWHMGAEARDTYGESMAPAEASPATMGNGLYKAVIETRDRPAAFVCPEWAHRWSRDADFEPRGSHVRTNAVVRPGNFDRPSRGRGRNPGDDPDGGVSHGWWVEYGGTRDTIRDAEEIRDELFRICVGLWDYAKNRNPATVEKNRTRELVWLNYVQGTRESRRLLGDYVLTQRDLDDAATHLDDVAFTDWGADVHHPEGFWVRGNDAIHVYKGRRTGIPYRTLYSRNIENLFMAGRCHSASQIAFGATRVMRPMCATGQAAGTAAALAKRYGATPRGVYEKHMDELQQTLLRDGCSIPGVPDRDPADWALKARAEASSAAPGLPAAAACDGWNRPTANGRSAWSPDPKAKGPHWLALRLPSPVALGEMRVTFEKSGVPCRVQAADGAGWRDAARLDGASRREKAGCGGVRTDAVRLFFDGAVPVVSEVRVYAADGSL